jgi:hypothetical protein
MASINHPSYCTTGTTISTTAFTIPSNGFLSYGTTTPSTTFGISGLGITGYSGTGTTSSGTYISGGNISSCTVPNLTAPNLTISSINQNAIMQNKVAVFKVTRNDENEITSAEFIKEMWVQTKNGQSVEFEVARDKDLAKYKAEDLSIRVILSVTF